MLVWSSWFALTSSVGRCTLAAVLVAIAPLLSAQASAQNVVLLIADDVGVDGIAAYGEQPNVGPTPNIDALAAQGVLFRNGWTNPICSPSRVSMLTGLRASQHGVGWYIDPNTPDLETGVDPDLPTLPRRLGLAGYRTAAFGKYHMGGQPEVWMHPLEVGFDYYSGFIWSGVDYFNWPKTVNGTAPDGSVKPAKTTQTTKYATTDTADDVLAELGVNEPHFLWVAFLAAHNPLHAPPGHLHGYDLDGVPISGNEPLYHKAMVEAMDREIGRILAAVDLSDTTVIFIGDNGTPEYETEPPFIPEHSKFSLFEGGVNVPLIIAGAAVAPAARGQESAALVQSTDLFATILEIAGAPGDTPSDSVSLTPYLSTPGMASIRAWTYAEMFKPNGGPVDPLRFYRTARESRYKLQRLQTSTDSFYDLVADPWELAPIDLASLTSQQQAAYDDLDLVIRNLPEPGAPLQLLAGVFALTGLARRRARWGGSHSPRRSQSASPRARPAARTPACAVDTRCVGGLQWKRRSLFPCPGACEPEEGVLPWPIVTRGAACAARSASRPPSGASGC